jgi:LysM repeat protein
VRTFPALGGVLLVALAAASGCAGSQPTERDFQVMQTAYNAESAQTQRTILDLRAEVQGLQRELGTSRASLARLEGELRDARGRSAEAQRVMDSQRDELSRLREERERTAQAAREIDGQLVELGRLRQQAADAAREQPRLQALEAAVEKQARDLADLKARAPKASTRFKTRLPNAELAAPPRDRLELNVSVGVPPAPGFRTIIVQPGDTLWDLARKHRVNLPDLITLNRLVSDRIRPGQELLLPDSPAE